MALSQTEYELRIKFKTAEINVGELQLLGERHQHRFFLYIPKAHSDLTKGRATLRLLSERALKLLLGRQAFLE